MDSTHKYVPEIDLLKFFFAVMVAVYHGAKAFHLSFFAKGYLAVEFFLLVTGFFMARTLRSDTTPTAARFLYRKIASIYAILFVSTAIAFIVRMVLVRASLPHVLLSAANAIWEFLLVREAGFRIGPEYNPPIWYVSSMILSMGVLYPLFQRFRSGGLLPVAALVCSLICYAALWHTCGSLVAGNRWTGFCTWRTVRAAAGLSLGVFLGEVVDLAQHVQFRPTATGRKVLASIFALSFAAFVALMASPPSFALPGSADFLALPVLFISLFLVLTNWGTLRFKNPERFCSFGTASLYIYVNHAAVLSVLRCVHEIPAALRIILLLAATVLLSLGCELAVRLLHTGIRHLIPVLFEMKS